MSSEKFNEMVWPSELSDSIGAAMSLGSVSSPTSVESKESATGNALH